MHRGSVYIFGGELFNVDPTHPVVAGGYVWARLTSGWGNTRFATVDLENDTIFTLTNENIIQLNAQTLVSSVIDTSEWLLYDNQPWSYPNGDLKANKKTSVKSFFFAKHRLLIVFADGFGLYDTVTNQFAFKESSFFKNMACGCYSQSEDLIYLGTDTGQILTADIDLMDCVVIQTGLKKIYSMIICQEHLMVLDSHEIVKYSLASREKKVISSGWNKETAMASNGNVLYLLQNSLYSLNLEGEHKEIGSAYWGCQALVVFPELPRSDSESKLVFAEWKRIEEEKLAKQWEREKEEIDKLWENYTKNCAEMKKQMETVVTFSSNIVKLNVGGTVYMTTRSTLTSIPNTIFEGMFSGKFLVKPEEDGTYFLDRDGTHYRYIINYLRDRDHELLPSDHVTLQELIPEASFLGLLDLTQHLKNQLASLQQLEMENLMGRKKPLRFSLGGNK